MTHYFRCRPWHPQEKTEIWGSKSNPQPKHALASDLRKKMIYDLTGNNIVFYQMTFVVIVSVRPMHYACYMLCVVSTSSCEVASLCLSATMRLTITTRYQRLRLTRTCNNNNNDNNQFSNSGNNYNKNNVIAATTTAAVKWKMSVNWVDTSPHSVNELLANSIYTVT